ncbi:TonB-dependent receptor [Rapidithrix thailandica]|uniref:TonB-dependent receptor n=1 Tax=Rapidithrix thailandica TaxID=413964 RepID=A0AAW9S742_9BACT
MVRNTTFHLMFAGLFLLSCISISYGQSKGSLRGKISFEGKAAEFIHVGLLKANLGAITDEQGHYEIKNIPYGKYTLQISAVGYETHRQEIRIQSGEPLVVNHTLEESSELMEEVVISGTLKEVSKLESPVPVEVYNPVYFQKNPTPALFEALQIVNGVRPQVNCSICNTGDIHINGMEGPYTMVLIDGMPIVSGLSSVYGLNGIPNSMIERVEVVKGPASTLYGSEAVGGLINVITKQPDKTPRFAVDVFATDWQEVNTDIGTRFKVGKATAMAGVNYFHYDNPIDRNGDGYTDLTNAKRLSLFNKWSFERKNNRVATLAGRYVYEDRWGAEMDWNSSYRGGTELYGESIYTERYELVGTYQLPLDSENLMFSYSFNSHSQNSIYGDEAYIAQQRIGFGQLLWDKQLGKHDLLLGGAFRYQYYDDNTAATRNGDEANNTNQPDKTYLPGLFVQDEITLDSRLKILLGMRYDYNSDHGNIFTPRFNLKWSPNRNNTLRLSAGTGYRVVNLFTEDHAATTGTRDVVLEEDLKPERSYNVNLNYQKFIDIPGGILTLDASAFYTYFFNKIIPDYETSQTKIFYRNLDGYAVSQGVSLNADLSFEFPLTANFGVTLMDVYTMDKDDEGKNHREKQLLTETVSGTWALSYTFHKPGISIDYSGNIYGPMKLPLQNERDNRSEFSDTYSIQNIKISKNFNNGLTIYGGVKNLLNFVPPSYSITRPHDPFNKQVEFDNAGNPIATSENPKALIFDTTYVYTSFQGIRGFFGISYSVR